MIIEAIFNAISGVFLLIINVLPDIAFSIPEGIFNGLSNITTGIGYVMPMGKLLPIFIVSIAVATFRVQMALFRLIKSLIPTMGD